jgi:hypothetical protein
VSKAFIVGVREIHVRHFSVQAENEEQAKDLVAQRDDSVTDMEFIEYSNELNRETWSVEEQR